MLYIINHSALHNHQHSTPDISAHYHLISAWHSSVRLCHSTLLPLLLAVVSVIMLWLFSQRSINTSRQHYSFSPAHAVHIALGTSRMLSSAVSGCIARRIYFLQTQSCNASRVRLKVPCLANTALSTKQPQPWSASNKLSVLSRLNYILGSPSSLSGWLRQGWRAVWCEIPVCSPCCVRRSRWRRWSSVHLTTSS